MSSSLSSSALRLFSPKLPLKSQHPLLPQTPPSLISFFPISFQRLSRPSDHPPFRAQQQQQEPPGAVDAEVDPAALPPALRDIVALFQSVPDPKSKYHQLLHYGRQLPPLDPRYKTDEHRVRGCVSQVWVRAFPDPSDPAAVRFEADSDSALTKGLAALLVFGLSGSPAPAIARVPPSFVHLLGLRQSLTPSRNNGFLNMLRLMQHKALQLDAHHADPVPELEGLNSGVQNGILAEKDLNSGKNPNGFGSYQAISEASGVNDRSGSVADDVLEVQDASLGHDGDGINGDLEVETEDANEPVAVASSSVGGLGSRAERIRERLEKDLSPVELVLEDISHLHAGHAGVRGSSGGETHFNLRVVSKEFEGKSLVKRHRLVYELLQEELQSGLHALSIDAKTPSEVYSS